jgi:DoxX-like protein
MKIAVWIASALLALFFLLVGGAKAFAPWEGLAAASMGVPVILLKIAGIAEILGAIGLILPEATGILPVLTPLAATGLALIMVGALVFHIRRNERPNIVVAIVLIALTTFVAVARFAGV